MAKQQKAKKPRKYIRKQKTVEARPLGGAQAKYTTAFKKKYKRLGKAAMAVPLKRSAKKSIARKVIGKLGAPGKAAVGASMLYDYVKSKQKGKKGCGPGMRKVTKNGKSYCAPSKGSKKGRDY